VTGTERREFAVVGGGLLGLAAARALRRRDRDVVVLEQAHVGHTGGGSHGAARIFRYGYPDVRYVQLAIAAGELWRELERATGTTLLEPTGQVSFGHGLLPMVDAMRAAGVPPEPLSDAELRARFPALAVDAPAVYEPASGVLVADRCLAALRDDAALDVREGQRVQRIDDDGQRVAVVTETLIVRADVAIVTAGPWSSAFLPVLANSACFTTLEHVAYVRAATDAAATTPVFIAHDEPACYGLPSTANGLYKVGVHHAGRRIDPEHDARTVEPAAVDAVAAAVQRYLPGFVTPPELVETCIYDNTPDEDFVVDRRGNVVVGAGTSGHGFKFGPLLGELLADLATGREPRFPLDAFALDRSALRR
jgi:sarcosine oxidase